VAKTTFTLTSPAAGHKHIDPAITAEPGGYLPTYDSDDPSSKSVSTYYQAFNSSGQPVGTVTAYPDIALNEVGVAVPITNIYNPRVASTGILGAILQTEALAPIAAIIAMLDDAFGYDPTNPTAIGMTFPNLGSLFGSSSASAPAPGASIARSNSLAPSTVLLTPIDDGVTRISPEIAELTNGDFVGVWDQHAPGDTTWSVVGQIVDPTGKFVGLEFTLATAVPVASNPTRPVLSALPNGQFVVVYSDADSSLAGQKFDASGNQLDVPFGVSNSTQGNAAAIMLSNGTLPTLTGSGGIVSATSFSVQAAGATWAGTTGTDLGTAGNWQPVAIPVASETLTFNTAAGGTLTGGVTGMNAVFSGASGWILQGGTMTLAGETVAPSAVLALTDNDAVTVNGGSISAGGSLDIETPTGVAMSVLGGAQVGI
jgi:hypothetical protein